MAEAAPAAPQKVGPGAVAPTPSTHPNAPAAVAAPVPPPADASPDAHAKYKALEAQHAKTQRELITERRQWANDRKTLAEKAAKADALEKRDAQARLNPIEFAKSMWGDDWNRQLNEMVANGGAPPAQMIQAEMQKLRDENEARWKARDEADAKGKESQATQATEQARRSIFADAASFYRAKAAEYPLLAKLAGPAATGPQREAAVARTIAQRIESEFSRTVQFDDAGNITQQGKVLTTSEAADLIEAEVLGWVSEAGKHEKYKAKLQLPPPSSTVAPSKQPVVSQPARRSVTNDITGSTAAPNPLNRTDKQRRADAEAAWEAARRKG